MMPGMRTLLMLLALCTACSPSAENADEGAGPPTHRFASQTTAATPDYERLLRAAALGQGTWQVREPTSLLPPGAKAIGDEWIARLKSRDALLGYGLAGKSPDGPVNLIDTGLTREEFDDWVAKNGWSVPKHIRWSFVPRLNLPSVGQGAKAAIRVWSASTARTGAQNEALFQGRVELRDGCFYVGEYGRPVDKLAWFHAEIGFDVDAEGYYILRNRVTGHTLARLGEEMNWGGPASAVIGKEAEQALRQACGDAELYVVGSPEASERFLTQYPHLRRPGKPPAPGASQG